MAKDPMNDIRDVLISNARVAPAGGPEYFETKDRMRRWGLDLAESMLPLYEAVNAVDAEMQMVDVDPIRNTIAMARVEFSGAYDAYCGNMQTLRAEIGALQELVDRALHYEEISDYSPLYSTSRAAIQAIQTALSTPDDYDVFSISVRLTFLAEQCALAHAYQSLDPEAKAGSMNLADVYAAQVMARKKHGPDYLGALQGRMLMDAPADFVAKEEAALAR